MTEERKGTKKRRVADAEDVVDAAMLSAVEQIQKRLDELSLERGGSRPVLQNMVSTDMWTKVLPFLCMSDAVSAYQGGYLHVPRPWQMELNDTLVMDFNFMRKYGKDFPRLIEFWKHSKLGANVRVWRVNSYVIPKPAGMNDLISCFHRLEEIAIDAPIAAATFAHLIKSTAKTMRRLDITLTLLDEHAELWRTALQETKTQWTELRLGRAFLGSELARALPPSLTRLHMFESMHLDSLPTVVTTLLRRCPDIVHLDLVIDKNLGEWRLDGAFAAAGKRNWVHLNTSLYGITDGDLAVIGCASLRHLQFCILGLAPLAIKQCLDACTALEYLSLRMTMRQDAATLVVGTRAAASLTALEFNNIPFSSLESDVRMIMHRGLPRLSELTFLGYMPDDYVRDLVELYSDAKRRNVLTHLRVDSPEWLSAASIAAILTNSNGWESIRIGGDWKHDVDSKTMHWLARECKALTDLKIVQCEIEAVDLHVLLKRPWRELELGPPKTRGVPTVDNIRIEDLRRLPSNVGITLHAAIVTNVSAAELLSLAGERKEALSLLVSPAVAKELRAISTHGNARPLNDLYPESFTSDSVIVDLGDDYPQPKAT